MPATNELLQEGRYRISQPASDDGSVFEAYDTVRNTTVLVHEFPLKLNKVTTLSQQESLRLAFTNQAKALSEIEHESLLHVQDYFSEVDRQFLVMESVDGENLRHLMDRSKRPFTVAEVTSWADQLLDALNYLHSRKPAIIHRNIQPGNLTLDPSGKVKLAGVGIDRGVDPDLSDTDQSDGSLRYSPMEQIWPGLDAASQKVITNSYDDRSERILKEPLDARSDIYSLGATLYFLITGVEPVDPLERSIDILEGKLDPLREATAVDPEIPAEISDVLMKALEIKRENRYDSAFIMREVLKTAIARVEERQAEDAREQEEAAAIIKAAAQAKVEAPQSTESVQEAEFAARAAEAKAKAEAEARAEAEAEAKAKAEAVAKANAEAKAKAEAEAAAEAAAAEKRRQEEIMQQQLRAAEEERRSAEKEAAEALQLMLLEEERTAETEKALGDKAEVEKSAAPEENLLEIPVSSEVVAYRDTVNVDESELAAVLEELEKAERESVAAEQSLEAEVVDSTNVADKVRETPSEIYSPIESELFAETEKRGFSLPMPAIAGAVGLVVVIGIGGWFAMSGSSDRPQPSAPAPAVEVVQPQPQPQHQEPSQANDVIISTQAQTDVNSSVPVEAAGDQTAVSPKAATSAKPKKAEPAKADAKAKKAVTVDDLINDN